MPFDPRAFVSRLEQDAPSSYQVSHTADQVLKARYLRKDKGGHVVEKPEGMLERVARAVSEAEPSQGGDRELCFDIFRLMMMRREFLPNSPTLINAGKHHAQLAACFVIPVDDSMEGIFEAVKQMAVVQKTGGGTGFSFSRLRPSRDIVASTHGVSSGPLSFMEVFDVATETVKQGGARRGANMGVLEVHHPDILSFITAKMNPDRLTNFNISVAVTDEFMRAASKEPGKDTYPLINPRTGKEAGRLRAGRVLELIANLAWQSGEPGVLFIDQINRNNPTPQLGRIESTNPCGELPLLPYESCNLGSINLASFVSRRSDEEPRVDWQRLTDTVWAAVRFLDDVVDVTAAPFSQIEEATLRNRKIGLGVMGFADALTLLGVSYASAEGLQWAHRFMSVVSEESKRASAALAEQRGPFPAFKGSRVAARLSHPVRNATTNTIAPTGTISIIAGCSSSIEPLYALAYKRNILDGETISEVHPLVEEVAKRRGVWSRKLRSHLAERGTLEGYPSFPEELRPLFLTAHEVAVDHHVLMQAAFQEHVDNSVSKTINLPFDSPPEDVQDAIWLAHRLGVKGLTFYRDRSREGQAIEAARPSSHGPESEPSPPRPPGPNVGPRCSECGGKTLAANDCIACASCGWSECSSP